MSIVMSEKEKKIVSKGEKVRLKINRLCKVAICRTLEAIIAFLIISLIVLIVGAGVIPFLSYQISSSVGLTQSTNLYIAVASWGLPMLFFVLLITAATFAGLKRFVTRLHQCATNIINKQEKGERDK